MKIILFVLFIVCVSVYGNSQMYGGFGVKAQRVNFFSIYETEEDYKYDPLTDSFIFIDGRDTSSQQFLSIGPKLCFGYNYELTDRILVGADFNYYLGMISRPDPRIYMDMSLAAGSSYLFNSSTFSNVFARIGFVYGYDHLSFDESRSVVGFNWRIGYEHDLDYFLLGAALEGNVFSEEIGESANSKKELLLDRRMNTIGASIYLKLEIFNDLWY